MLSKLSTIELLILYQNRKLTHQRYIKQLKIIFKRQSQCLLHSLVPGRLSFAQLPQSLFLHTVYSRIFTLNICVYQYSEMAVKCYCFKISIFFVINLSKSSRRVITKIVRQVSDSLQYNVRNIYIFRSSNNIRYQDVKNLSIHLHTTDHRVDVYKCFSLGLRRN